MAKKRFTKEQMQLESIIREMGFETVLEVQFGDYFTDIYLPEIHVAVEYDGPQHISKKKDRKRDEELLDEYSLPVFRVGDLKDPELRDNLIKFFDRSNDEKKNI